MLRLNTFAISHFSEKARWAMDLSGLEYAERRLIPGPHMVVVRMMAKGTSVPVLEHDGHVVQGSSAILDYLEQSLGVKRLAPPADLASRSSELEAQADLAFGLGVQRIVYDVLLEDRETVTRLWAQDGPSWGPAFYSVAFPVVARAIKRMYSIRPDAVLRAKDRFRAAFDAMDTEVERGELMGGEQPTRLDITVAALLAPLCRPPEHLMAFPEVPPAGQPFLAEFEGRPTWNHVLRLYREHRGSSSRPAVAAAR